MKKENCRTEESGKLSRRVLSLFLTRICDWFFCVDSFVFLVICWTRVGRPTLMRCHHHHHSRVLEEDRLCDTVGAHCAAVGGWARKRQGRSSRMSPSQFEVWVVHAPWRRTSHAGEATDESDEEGSNREELDSETVWLDCCVVLFRVFLSSGNSWERRAVFFFLGDFNTVQVKSIDTMRCSYGLMCQLVCVPHCRVDAWTPGSWLVDDVWTESCVRLVSSRVNGPCWHPRLAMQNGWDLVTVLSGQGNELWWPWRLTTESELNLGTDLSESELWWYQRHSLKCKRCSFVTW